MDGEQPRRQLPHRAHRYPIPCRLCVSRLPWHYGAVVLGQHHRRNPVLLPPPASPRHAARLPQMAKGKANEDLEGGRPAQGHGDSVHAQVLRPRGVRWRPIPPWPSRSWPRRSSMKDTPPVKRSPRYSLLGARLPARPRGAGSGRREGGPPPLSRRGGGSARAAAAGRDVDQGRALLEPASDRPPAAPGPEGDLKLLA